MFSNKKREDAIVRLVQQSVESYEELMYEVYSSAATASDLDSSHHKTKAKITEDLPAKWKAVMGSSKMSTRLIPKATEEIDATYARLKRHFELSKQKEHNKDSERSTVESAIKHYTSEMEKCMENGTGTDMKHAQTAHDDAFSAALKMVKEGNNVSATAIQELKKRIDDSFKEFKARIKMMEDSKKDPAIGIDLGTTMCCVAVYFNGKVDVIPNRAQGSSKTTPSYVAYHEDGSDTFGSVAKEEAYMYPETTIYDAKRMIGRFWTDDVLESDRKHWPFEVVNEQGNPRVKTWKRTRFPHEISAKLLAQFRLMADEFLGLPPGSVRKAVVTVPAYFTEPQRRATSEAAECAGLKVLNILSEPTAAAIAYSAERRNKGQTRKALIYDLGGGTFDVAIAVLQSENVEILAVDGDTHLGGQDFDQMLMNYCIEEFLKKEKVDLRNGKDSTQKTTRDKTRSALARLKLQCERAKERLSTSNSTKINVERIHGDKHLSMTLTKEKFEALIRPLVLKTIQIIDRALDAAKSSGVKNKSDIDDIILVGGSTRIPLVGTMVASHFGDRQLCKHINPDEAVAYGAAIQAVISNNPKSIQPMKVQDVTPMTLGVENHDGKFSRIMPKNSKIPCEKTQVRHTMSDNQTQMKFTVFQGEHDEASDNKKLGEFSLNGFPPKPAKEEKAKVTMRIDADGLLHVDAVSQTTKNTNSITISFDGLAMNKSSMDCVKKEIAESISHLNHH